MNPHSADIFLSILKISMNVTEMKTTTVMSMLNAPMRYPSSAALVMMDTKATELSAIVLVSYVILSVSVFFSRGGFLRHKAY